MTNFEKVKEFTDFFGMKHEKVPSFPDDDHVNLRVGLIEEELQELKDAIADRNIVEVADALTDILYVVYGAGLSFGVDLDACLEEVHQSNMSKLGADGKPIYREDGKLLKGPNYWRPNLAKVLEKQNG